MDYLSFNIYLLISADDGALLTKIHKVKVLRNHKREGKKFCFTQMYLL